MYGSYYKNQRIMYGPCTDHVRIMCVHTVWVFPPVGNHHVWLSDDGFACVGKLLLIPARALKTPICKSGGGHHGSLAKGLCPPLPPPPVQC